MRLPAPLRAPRTTRLVRFGYRRPPPWPRPPPSEDPKKAKPPSGWRELRNANVNLEPIAAPIGADGTLPTLAHGLEPVLRGDGVYPLEAPWTMKRELLYADSLRRIVPPERIAWHTMAPYVPAGEDGVLKQIANDSGARFYTSTSSATGVLGLLYHLISNFREPELVGGLSEHMKEMPGNFARMHRKPVAIVLNEGGMTSHGGEGGGPSILRDLGQSMERMLTMGEREFWKRYVRGDGEDEKCVYRYTKVGDVLVRAQIDCMNGGTGEVFDVKTRATAPIRYDLGNWMRWRGKRLKKLQGRWDSYEREFYDMVRSVFLKYAMQLKLGRMHGALVAYHNTAEILGLEYLNLEEIESYVFGNTQWANVAMGSAFGLLEEILKVVGRGKVIFCNEWSRLKMLVFVQDVEHGDAFGPDRFEIDVEEVSVAGGSELFHIDASAVSIVGGEEIKLLGGERIVDSGRVRRVKVGVDHRGFDSTEIKKVLRVWELEVLPTVNGDMMVRGEGRVGQDDEFCLYWNLEEVEVRKEHVAKFVASLDRIYDSS